MTEAVLHEAASDLSRAGDIQDAGAPRLRSSRVGPKASLAVLGIAIALYLGLCFQILRAGYSQTGALIYPLDDTYIGMAIAKNVAAHGVWGISTNRFGPAASSPGFTLLLSGLYWVTGPKVWGPVALSLIFGLLSLVMAWRTLGRTHWGVQLAALVAMLYFAPLHVVGLIGMEHTAHLFLVLAFLKLFGDSLEEKTASGNWTLLLVTSVMVSVRYESLFMVGIAGLLCVSHRRWLAASRLGCAAAVPVLLYAVVSVSQGADWLPQSIAIKGLSPIVVLQSPLVVINHFEKCLSRAPYLGVLLCIMVVLLTLPQVLADGRLRGTLDIVFGAILLHLFFADVGKASLYRYEAYLVGASIVTIACALPTLSPTRDRWQAVAIGAFAVVAAVLLTQRTVDAAMSFPERAMAVYSQQIQMARFMSRYEQGAAVAANDVGAINYFADIDCLDLVGLADRDVFWLKRKNLYTNRALTTLAADRKIKIAVVYDYWFSILTPVGGPPLPLSWIRVQRWRTPYGQYLGGDMVSFYATTPAEAARLKTDLDAFDRSLPPGVDVLDN